MGFILAKPSSHHPRMIAHEGRDAVALTALGTPPRRRNARYPSPSHDYFVTTRLLKTISAFSLPTRPSEPDE